MEIKFPNPKLILLLLCLNLILPLITSTEATSRYEDNLETSMRRLEFARNYTDRVTGGKVNFEYTDEKGVFCKAAKHLYDKEFTFDIPKEFIACSFDMYPFKFELKEPIHKFLIKKYGKNRNETYVKTPMYMFTLGLMFMKYENKTEVYDYLRKTGREYYIANYTTEMMDYLESLPTVTYSSPIFGEEERKLQELTGYGVEKDDEAKGMHEAIVRHVLRNMKDDSEFILPWLNDLYLFKYWTSIITSRAYKSNLIEYEKLMNKTILSMPKGKKHKEILQNISPQMIGTCLVPFVDLCNHKNAMDPHGKSKVEFLIIFKKDRLRMAFMQEYQAGEDYEYSYIPFAPNEKLLNNYGFYVEDNLQSIAQVLIPIQKRNFPKAKHDLCVKLNCFDSPFEHFYTDNNLQSANVQAFINRFDFNDRIFKAIKLLMWPVEKFDSGFLFKRLSKGKMLNYHNEIWALAFYRQSLLFSSDKNKLKLVDIIYSLYETRNYFKQYRNEIVSNPKKRYVYRLRRRIMQVAKEHHKILYTNVKIVNDKIKNVLSDQFAKIRNFYATANLENLTQ